MSFVMQIPKNCCSALWNNRSLTGGVVAAGIGIALVVIGSLATAGVIPGVGAYVSFSMIMVGLTALVTLIVGCIFCLCCVRFNPISRAKPFCSQLLTTQKQQRFGCGSSPIEVLQSYCKSTLDFEEHENLKSAEVAMDVFSGGPSLTKVGYKIIFAKEGAMEIWIVGTTTKSDLYVQWKEFSRCRSDAPTDEWKGATLFSCLQIPNAPQRRPSDYTPYERYSRITNPSLTPPSSLTANDTPLPLVLLGQRIDSIIKFKQSGY